MSRNDKIGRKGSYQSFNDLLAFYHRKRKEYFRGVTLKWQQSTQLRLQFIHPATGKCTSKTCGVSFTSEGIINAIAKAHKVKEALSKLSKVSQFWQWYDKEILEVNTLKNDLKTYRDIFQEIEDKYFNGKNKYTKRERSKDIPSDVNSFNNYYGNRFKRFSNLDKSPESKEMKQVLFYNP